MLQHVEERAMRPPFFKGRRAKVGDVAHHKPAIVGKCIPRQVGEYPDQQSAQDQKEPFSRTPWERGGEPDQPLLVSFWSQADQGKLHQALEDPEQRQAYRQTEEERP